MSPASAPCSDFAEQTRRRLEEAARRKEAEEREKAAQRYQRREHLTGQVGGQGLKTYAALGGRAELGSLGGVLCGLCPP